MKKLTLLIGLIGVAIVPQQCGAQILDDPFADYAERSIMVFPGGGNANDANAAIHTIDPWPPYVGHTRIPDDGRRAFLGVERMYRAPNPFFGQGQGAGTSSLSQGAAGTGSSGTGSGGAGFDTGVGTMPAGGAGTGLQPVPAVPSGY
jgi:hypothetical protein